MAMLRTMVTQLIHHERIETTLPKAKELRRIADQAVTLAKQGTLTARRKAQHLIRTDEARHKLFTEMVERYKSREGGYTRILRTQIRRSDGAQLAYIEYVDWEGELRSARPPQKKLASLLPAAAQAAVDGR